jgi:hypothetical protein
MDMTNSVRRSNREPRYTIKALPQSSINKICKKQHEDSLNQKRVHLDGVNKFIALLASIKLRPSLRQFIAVVAIKAREPTKQIQERWG